MAASKYAETLNALCAMQKAIVYALRRQTLKDAEEIIVDLEKQVDQMRAALRLCVRGDGSAEDPIRHEFHFTAKEMEQIRAAIA